MWFAIEKEKIFFMESEITHLGFRINKNGVNSLSEKVAALPFLISFTYKWNWDTETKQTFGKK